LHQHQQLTRVRCKKERQNQHILSTNQCAQKILRSLLFFERLSKDTITFFRAKALSFVVSFFLLKDKNHAGDFIIDDAKE